MTQQTETVEQLLHRAQVFADWTGNSVVLYRSRVTGEMNYACTLPMHADSFGRRVYPSPTPERLAEFAEFVRLNWDGENLADAFVDYGEATEPLHPYLMEVLRDELAFRRVMAE